MGNDNKVEAKGKGNINILTKKGEQKKYSNVYFILSLKHNLMSIGQLIKKGYTISFKNWVCTILDNFLINKLISKVQMTNDRVFLLNINLNLNVEKAQTQP